MKPEKKYMERKYRNFETFIPELKEKLREMLYGYKIRYELSGVGNGWHFEILCNDEEEEIINQFLDRYFEHEYLSLRAS